MKRFYSFSKLAIFAVAVFVGAYLPSTISLSANGKQASVSLPANISVVNVPSKAMNKAIPTMIVLPSSYDVNKTKKYPVLYLLHGFGGNHTSWLRIRPDIQKLASQFEMIIVSPDGFKSSWYWDSPIDPTVKYETFVSKELVEYIDLNYRTNATRKG